MPVDDETSVATPSVADKLGRAIRVPTVSVRGQEPGSAPAFAALRELVATQWPHARGVLDVEVVSGALLMTWSGSDRSLADHPAMFMAHQDVVGITGIDPATVTPETPAPGWSVPPFSGEVLDGAVRGRGALDDKGSLCALMEALDSLAAAGHRPVRDIVVSLGCDEEQDGSSARAVAEVLRGRGIHPWFVLDEGGAVVEGALPGVAGRIAVVGVSEKGVVDLRLTASDAGGHASTPPRRGATFRLARAITRIEHRPFPVRLSEPVVAMLELAAPHTEGPLARVYARARTLAPAIARVLAASGAETAALVRTTVAVTQLSGSAGLNVLATSASAGLNVRIAVGETLKGTLARIRRVVHDPAVTVEVVSASEPSPVSPSQGAQWEALGRALATSHPDAVLLPYVQMSASDSRHFTSLSDHVYRFTPFEMSAAERATIHGPDERIRVKALEDGVVFYQELVRGL